jgi:putative glutamine amidotransferase
MGGAPRSDRPLIGVTTSEVRIAESVTRTPQGDPPRREMALGLSYLKAIEAAGALPVVIPPLELGAVKPMLDRLAGVCLSGGPDLDPESYSTRRHAELGPTEPELDRFEIALAREALSRNLPILAICRGAQALNVAAGGTLHQHLPDRPQSSVEHRQSAAADEPTHGVRIEAGSLLARTLGRRACTVNSFHHQAARRVGRGLRAVAWSPDGVVEGLEAPGRDFVVGVQWHAECLTDMPEQSALFGGLIGAARRYDLPSRSLRAA